MLAEILIILFVALMFIVLGEKTPTSRNESE